MKIKLRIKKDSAAASVVEASKAQKLAFKQVVHSGMQQVVTILKSRATWHPDNVIVYDYPPVDPSNRTALR
jgi:hypothetical protein